MDDDFNTAGAIAAVFEMIKFCRKTLDKGEMEKECLELMKNSVVDLCRVLGLRVEKTLFDEMAKYAEKMGISEDELMRLIKNREDARTQGNFAISDQIRDNFRSNGIVIEDTPFGPKLK